MVERTLFTHSTTSAEIRSTRSSPDSGRNDTFNQMLRSLKEDSSGRDLDRQRHLERREHPVGKESRARNDMEERIEKQQARKDELRDVREKELAEKENVAESKIRSESNSDEPKESNDAVQNQKDSDPENGTIQPESGESTLDVTEDNESEEPGRAVTREDGEQTEAKESPNPGEIGRDSGAHEADSEPDQRVHELSITDESDAEAMERVDEPEVSTEEDSRTESKDPSISSAGGNSPQETEPTGRLRDDLNSTSGGRMLNDTDRDQGRSGTSIDERITGDRLDAPSGEILSEGENGEESRRVGERSTIGENQPRMEGVPDSGKVAGLVESESRSVDAGPVGKSAEPTEQASRSLKSTKEALERLLLRKQERQMEAASNERMEAHLSRLEQDAEDSDGNRASAPGAFSRKLSANEETGMSGSKPEWVRFGVSESLDQVETIEDSHPQKEFIREWVEIRGLNQHARASMRLDQMPVANLELRRHILPSLTRGVSRVTSGDPTQQGSWQKHQLTLDDGQKLNLMARRDGGVLQLKLQSSNPELNRLLVEHQQEIRQHLEKECGLEIDLQLDQGEDSGQSTFDDWIEQKGATSSQSSPSGSGNDPVDETTENHARIRSFGYNRMEWTG